jgi:hypothetical protein
MCGLAAIVSLTFASAGAARQPGPCSLVSEKQVATVVGAAVSKQVLAPLGPTCIYKFKHNRKQLTIALGTERFSSLVAQIPRRKRRRVSVRGHTGYCGVLGQPILYVSLAHKQVLTITASCPDARKLAAIAVHRL